MAAQPPLATADEIIGLLFPDTLNDIAIRLWNRTFAHGGHSALCTLVINEPETVRELLLHPNLFRLVEVYLDDGLDVEGDFETLFKLGNHFKTLDLHLVQHAFISFVWLYRFRKRTNSAQRNTAEPSTASGKTANKALPIIMTWVTTFTVYGSTLKWFIPALISVHMSSHWLKHRETSLIICAAN